MTSILGGGKPPAPNEISIANAFSSSLLSVARQASRSGVGLSSSSRQGVEAFLSSTQGYYNSMFSLATGPSLTIEGMKTQIAGLRATLPITALDASVVTVAPDETKGTNVDTEA
jgi:hypothetical protein